jgi:hypothetical protein
MSTLPDFNSCCEAACIKLWGEPNHRSKSDLRWNGADGYSVRTYSVPKKVWYDHGAKRGGSTLELAAFAMGWPEDKPLRGADFYTAWRSAYERGFYPEPPPEKKSDGLRKELRVRTFYSYHDEQRVLLYQVIRYDTEVSDDRFGQRRPDGESGWIGKLGSVRRVLYRLPELIAGVKAGKLILDCEGENDAEAAVELGYVATTHPGGIGKWRDEYDEFFRDADVVVVSDNDEHGKGQADAKVRAEHLSRVAKRVRIIMFDDVKDLREWVEAFHSREELDAIIAQAPDYVPPPPPPPPPPTPRKRNIKIGGKYMDSKTTMASNLANAMLALEQEPELVNVFGYDEMQRVEVLLRPLFGNEADFKPRPVTDADVTRVQEHLHWLGMKRLGKDAIHDAINTHARDHAFHPVRDYLSGLSWGGKGRLGTWLSTYLGAEQNDYTEQVGTMFLIGMVARIFEPGCKFDYMLILEGGQALLKSSACAILAGRRYFSDQLPDITSKEASQHLRGKWLIEVAELNAYSRAAIDHFKAYLVRQVERYRPPWGHKEVHEPRQCAFIGTTNKSRYLRDETGNRRFWPVGTGEINLDALGRDRDQLLAEAVSLYRSGAHWWPDRDFELQVIAPEQETRYETDAWEPLIRDYLQDVNRTSVLHIATGALGYELEPPESQAGEPPPPRGTPINRLGPTEQQRITRILTHLGWEPKRNKRERWWVRGSSTADDTDDTEKDNV